MHSIIINGDKLMIKEFKNFLWIKKSAEQLPKEFETKPSIMENALQNGGFYICENDEYTLYAFLADIGISPHPLIEFSYASTWYNSNLGGVYVVGKDKNNEFFAPIII